MQQSKSRCRPLIKPTFPIEGIKFINFPYLISSKQLQSIKTHLPKTFNFVGVDFQNEGYQPDKKQIKGCKVIAFNGIQKGNNHKLEFYAQKQILTFIWSINILLSIPYNSKTLPQKKNNQIAEYLDTLSKNYIHMVDSQGKIIKNQDFSCSELHQTKAICGSPCLSTTNSTNTTNISTVLPVVICFSTKLPLNSNQVLRQVKSDIVNSLSIIIKNQLPIRVIQQEDSNYFPLNLQTFVSEKSQIEKNQFQTMFAQIFQTEKIQRKVNEINQEKQLSNTFLYLFLGILIGIYIVFKATNFKEQFA